MNNQVVSWKSFPPLFLATFVLYNLLWAFTDKNIIRDLVAEGIPLIILLVDAVVCLAFTAISLLYSYLIFRFMPPMHDSYRRMLVYGSALFLLNSVSANLVVNVFDWTQESDPAMLRMKSVYVYGMIAAFVTGISSNRFYYKLRPIDPEEVEAAIAKVRQADRPDLKEEAIRELVETVRNGGVRHRERFLLPYRDGFTIVAVADINHVYTENRTTCLALNNGTAVTVGVSMDEMERQLDPDRFFRANRQFIISIDHILYIGKYFGGKLVVHLKGYDKVEIVVSKERAAKLKEWLDR